jgi:hypothetical protein
MTFLPLIQKALPMDEYDLKARFTPGVAAIAPALMVAMVAIPGLAQAKLAAGSLGAMALAALQMAALPLVRAAGRARQEALYEEWGGKPTTAMLRHRDTRINPLTKRRLHEKLRRLGPDFPVPTEEEEQENPRAADTKYEAVANEVRERAKAKKIKAVHRENIGYGAARNLYGLKLFGIAVCLASLLTLAWLVHLHGDFVPNPSEFVVALAVVVVMVAWVGGCTSAMVRQHGEAYAYALFEAVDEVVPLKVGRRKKSE